MEINGKSGPVTLPVEVDCEPGTGIVIRNTLPDNISDGMTLMFRTSIEDIYVYIDGKLRETYASSGFKRMPEHLPSAYVVTEIGSRDAGRELIFKNKKQWWAVYRVLAAFCNYPVKKTAFVKKIVAVAALGCALLASQAFAYETGEYSKEALRRGDDKPVVVKDYPVVAIEDVVASPQLYTEKPIAVQGPIRYFVTRNMYEMQADNGTRLRADFLRLRRAGRLGRCTASRCGALRRAAGRRDGCRFSAGGRPGT